MKIVKFENETYGLRKLTVLGYEFFDIVHGTWWAHFKYLKYKKECQFSLDEAKFLYDMGKPITEDTAAISRFINYIIKKVEKNVQRYN